MRWGELPCGDETDASQAQWSGGRRHTAGHGRFEGAKSRRRFLTAPGRQFDHRLEVTAHRGA